MTVSISHGAASAPVEQTSAAEGEAPSLRRDRRHAPSTVSFGEALVVLVQADPGPLEKAAHFTRSLGGAEVNVAIGLAAHGISSSVVTRVGADGFGRFVTEELTRHGVDASGVEVVPDSPTGLYIKEVGGTTGAGTDLGPGLSRMHYYRAGSAASGLSPETLELPAVARLLDRAALVHTSGITPALSESARSAQTALFRARRPGQLIAFDLNWRPSLWRGRQGEAADILGGCLRSCDIALVGVPEARAVFGCSRPEELRGLFPEPRWLVVKNDSNAATAFDGQKRVDVPALTVDVVEAIGAGDAFASGMLAGILHRLPLDDCIAQAHRVAARVLRSAGDHVVPPSPGDLAALSSPGDHAALPPGEHPAPDGNGAGRADTRPDGEAA